MYFPKVFDYPSIFEQLFFCSFSNKFFQPLLLFFLDKDKFYEKIKKINKIKYIIINRKSKNFLFYF